MAVQQPGHLKEINTSMPGKWVHWNTEEAAERSCWGARRQQRQWLVGRQEDSVTFLKKEVEGEGGKWGSAPCMFCSWKDRMLSPRKDCSEWEKGNRQKEFQGRVSCSLPQGSGSWTSGTRFIPIPSWGSSFQVVGTSKPQELSTHLLQLCGTPIPFPLVATPNLRRKSAPTPKRKQKFVLWHHLLESEKKVPSYQLELLEPK